MLRKANELRAEARRTRRLRQEVAEATRKSRAEAEAREEAEKKRKKRRDEEIRAFLLPLAESLKRTGYRIKPIEVTNRSAPVLRIYRSNAYPSETIEIYWKEPFLTGEMGFYWE